MSKSINSLMNTNVSKSISKVITDETSVTKSMSDVFNFKETGMTKLK